MNLLGVEAMQSFRLVPPEAVVGSSARAGRDTHISQCMAPLAELRHRRRAPQLARSPNKFRPLQNARPWVWLVVATLLAFATAAQTNAQPKAEAEKEADTASPADPLGRDTPRGLHSGLVSAMAESDFSRAAQFLELGKLSDEKANLRAKALKQALDESGSLVPYLQTSNAPEGQITDGLAPDEERLGELRLGGAAIPIIAHRTKQADGTSIWRISKQSLASVPADLPALRADEVERITIAGVSLLDWSKLLGIGLGLLLSFWTIFILVHRLLQLMFPHAVKTPIYRYIYAAVPPFILYASIFLLIRFAELLDIDIVARTALRRFAGAGAWLALIWFLSRLIKAISDLTRARMREKGLLRGVEIVTFCRRLITTLLIAAGVVIVLATFGIDVTAGLAALGIGGLAFALGARKAVEDLIGSISIIADQPVRVGDHCRFDDVEGHVVDIGMRSTRIRTLEGAILTIPNSKFADSNIENLTGRDHFFVLQNFGIAHSVGAAGVEAVLTKLREEIEAFPEAIPRPDAVRFLGFGDSNLRFQIRTNLRCANRAEGRLLQEKLLIRIIREIENLGIEIALPGHVLQVLEGPYTGSVGGKLPADQIQKV